MHCISNLICRKCPLRIQCYDFLADLMLLRFHEFDIILEIDWLTLHDAVLNCRLKRFDLKCHTNEMITIESDKLDNTTRITLTISSQKLNRKGC